jgi:hypothetical protein
MKLGVPVGAKAVLNLLALLLIVPLMSVAVLGQQGPPTGLISVNGTGFGSGNGGAAFGPPNFARISRDGRFVVFVSEQNDLVLNDTNSSIDVFLRDRLTGQTKLVSVNASGTGPGNSFSGSPVITPDGRYVAFKSSASNLVSDDSSTMSHGDVYVRDMLLGMTRQVSRNLSNTGRGNGESGWNDPLAISADGRFIAFISSATDLVPNDNNNQIDAFVRDMQTNTTILLGIDSTGAASGTSGSGNPAISADGRYVAFRSSANFFVRDMQTGVTRLVTANRSGAGGNGPADDRAENDLAISADGRFVAFVSSASDLVEGDNNSRQDVFVRDTQTNTTRLVSVNAAGTASGNANSGEFTMTPDGRFVAFVSAASDLAPGDSNADQDVYVRDMTTGVTTLVSVNRNGAAGGVGNTAVPILFFDYLRPAISDDGRYVAFTSSATDLTDLPDNNGPPLTPGGDILLRDRQAGTTRLVSINYSATSSGNAASGSPSMAADGSGVAYFSNASDLIGYDSNGGFEDVFYYVNFHRQGQIHFRAAVTRAGEAEAKATVTVVLEGGADVPVSVDYSTADGTAIAGSDYAPASGTLTFAPGEAEKTFEVQLLNDQLDEDDETIVVRLSNQTNNVPLSEPSIAVVTIADDDQPPTVTVDDKSVLEGNSGLTAATFTVRLSEPSGRTTRVQVNTAPGSATSGTDFRSVSGQLTLSPGRVSATVTVSVIGDTIAEEDETFTLNLSAPSNVTIGRGQAVGTILDDDSSPPRARFAATQLTVGEGSGRANVTVMRTGDTSAASTVDVRTVDDTRPIRCDDTVAAPGVAFARCDYSTTVQTITFAAGETTKTFSVPIIDDSFVEPNETVQLVLSNPSGATLGAQAVMTLTITSDDAPGASNPINNTDFFVRMQYLDFLSREPEAGQPWSATLNNCAVNDPLCDRISVSANFFRSQEFQLKGLFVYRFYKVAFGRQPLYAEIIPDMASVTGATTAELIAKKAAFTNAWVQRQEFVNTYGTLTNQQFVDMLMNRYNLPQVTTLNPASPDDTQAARVTLTRSDMVNQLTTGTLTRGQVVRAIADSNEVGAAEFNPAFVAMQYFGYLRRDPETGGYNAWLQTINANPADFRSMVNGFMNSTEYRLRFGQP